ncbi:MAG: ABC transporter permease, partial [Ilumatobacteraceae bacterium]
LFPLLLLAGMLLPIQGGPGWLTTLSALNPLTYVVDAQRSLFSGGLWTAEVAQGAVAAAAVAAIGLWVGTRTMQASD